MKYHRYSEIWPLLEGDAFEKLKADIKANGQKYNILIYQGQVLDGRNRLRALEAQGLTPRFADAGVPSDEAALKLVISLNEHRRHLSVAERAFAAEKLANIIQGNRFRATVGNLALPSGSATVPASSTVSIGDAATMLGVSPGSVARARVIRTHGTDADVADVIAGKASLQTTAEKVRPVQNPRVKIVPRRAPAPTPTPAIRPIERPRLQDVLLTPQQVDPEFKGSKIDFIDKYGHVHAMTAEQRAKQRFDAWVSNLRALAKEARRLPDWPEVDHNWLRNPNAYGVAKLSEALEFLRPKIAEAEALLACATGAMEQRQA